MLIANKSKCKVCGDIIQSKHIHNFVTCKCKSISLDGGLLYRKEINKENHENISIYKDSDFETIRENLLRNGVTLLKDMSNDWLENCIDYKINLRPDNPYLKFYKKELEYRKLNNIFIKNENK